MRCLNCKYDLTHLTGPPHRCPECGGEFDPDDPHTFVTKGALLNENMNALLYGFFFISVMLATVSIASWIVAPPESIVVPLIYFMSPFFVGSCLWYLSHKQKRREY